MVKSVGVWKLAARSAHVHAAGDDDAVHGRVDLRVAQVRLGRLERRLCLGQLRLGAGVVGLGGLVIVLRYKVPRKEGLVLVQEPFGIPQAAWARSVLAWPGQLGLIERGSICAMIWPSSPAN